MRSQLECKLAILTFQKEREVVQEETMFGDNNHTIIDYSIDVINGDYDTNDLYELEEEGQLSDGERSSIEEIYHWLHCEGEELVELLWNEENLVTELPGETVVNKTHCAKMCKECPFSKNSLKGWLSDYTGQDILNFMSAEASFPCHLQMSDGDLNIDETKEAIANGKMKLCRGYVECIIKSGKSPYVNKQLVDVIAMVREEGLSDDSMNIFEFLEHHNVINK